MILVLGGHGQLGTELMMRARAGDIPLTAVGHDEVDVGDPRTIARAVARYRPTVIVNAAAFNNVDRAEAQPAAAQRVNALGPSVVAASAKRAGLPVIHISTDYVFDGEKAGSYREDDPVGPINVYGRTKEKGEEGVRNGHARHLILRTSWLYGVHGANFVKTVVRLAKEKETLGFPAAQRASPTSTADMARAILLAAAALGTDFTGWGTYHVAGPGSASRHEMAVAIVEAQARFTRKRPAVEIIAP
ncbi:MAG TPA: dTDP-4-dehydrorhamnose reductase, partial [Bauldia sp.]|nr:dTDP-4-dehydrorhamnose reductase [Bauldia sp.]